MEHEFHHFFPAARGRNVRTGRIAGRPEPITVSVARVEPAKLVGVDDRSVAPERLGYLARPLVPRERERVVVGHPRSARGPHVGAALGAQPGDSRTGGWPRR